jgi:hypothetical protein
MHLDILIPAAVGVLTTMIGVLLGGRIAFRAQARHWARDRQAEACVAVLRESTKVQLALRRRFKDQSAPKVEWAPWNESLTVLQMVADSRIVDAAQQMDLRFWDYSSIIRDRLIVTEEQWAAVREPMEASRLAFINAARRHLVGVEEPVRSLVARPSLAEQRRRHAVIVSAQNGSADLPASPD